MEVKVSLDEQQMAQLQSTLAKPSPTFWKSDAFLRTVQAIAIVVGGCWVLVQFVLFERTRLELELNKSAADLEKTRLQTRLDMIEEQKRSLELVSSKTYRFSAQRTVETTYLRPLDSKTALYEVEYSMTVTNQSAVSFNMSLWVLDYFIGDVRENLQKKSAFIEPVGYPQNRWNLGSATGGAVEWRRVGSRGGMYAAARGAIDSSVKSRVSDVEFTVGRGLTGPLKPSQSYEMSETFLVKGTPGSYVAFVQSICFENCRTDEDLYSTSENAKLPARPPADMSKSAAQRPIAAAATPGTAKLQR
jgi:hypothetical protein